MNSIFDKTDFRLCNVPVPTGYPQSQTHAGVQEKNGIVLMTTSPFPSIRRPIWESYLRAFVNKLSFGFFCKYIRGELFENPLLYYSSDSINFKLLQSKPIMETPDPFYGFPAYNSDPDLYLENDDIYILNRVVLRSGYNQEDNKHVYVIRLYLIHGVLDDVRFKMLSTRLILESSELSVSPCLTKFHDSYYLFQLYTNCYNDGDSFDGLRFLKSGSIDGLKDESNWISVCVDTSIYIPWHMSVFEFKDTLYSIVTCVKRNQPQRCVQLFGEFDEAISRLKIYPIPLTTYNSYRGAAFVSCDGIFYLYTTTVGERIKGGNSVDGREVLIAQKPFEQLIEELRKWQ